MQIIACQDLLFGSNHPNKMCMSLVVSSSSFSGSSSINDTSTSVTSTLGSDWWFEAIPAHIFHHGLEQTISMVQNQKAFEITHQGWKYPHISQTSTASKITIATNRNGKWRNGGILPIGSVQNPSLFHCTGWQIGNPRMAGDNICG